MNLVRKISAQLDTFSSPIVCESSVHCPAQNNAAASVVLQPVVASIVCIELAQSDSLQRSGNQLVDIQNVSKDRCLELVFGLQSLNVAQGAGLDHAGDGCSLMLASLMDGWLLHHGDIVQLPLFGMPARGEAGVAVKLVLPGTIGDDERQSQGRIFIRAGVTRFAAVPDSSEDRWFPRSPLEWAAACLGEPSAPIAGRDTPLAQVIALAWGSMCSSSVRAATLSAHCDAGDSGAAPKPHDSIGIVLTGAPGSGKSALALSVARAMRRPCFRITSSGLYSGQAGGTEKQLSELVAAAVRAAPCTVLIEDAHIILPARPSSPLARRAMLLLLRAMDECATARIPLLWMACAEDVDGMHASALGPSRFRHCVDLPPMSPQQRERALGPLISRWLEMGKEKTVNVDEEVDTVISQLAEWTAARTHGFSPADLTALLAESARVSSEHLAPATEDLPSLQSIMALSLNRVRPSVALHAIGSLPRPVLLSNLLPIPIADSVGSPAYHVESDATDCDAMRIVRAAVLAPLENPGVYAQLGSTPPTGVIIHGPPGSGKTSLAHAIAHEARQSGLAQALVVSGPDIISALVGSSETALAAVFARARELSPCIIVLDNFEALAPARAYVPGRRHGATAANASDDRLLSVLLTEMDGVANSAPPPPQASGVGLHRPCKSALAGIVFERGITPAHAPGSGQRPLSTVIAAQHAAAVQLAHPYADDAPVVIVIAITRDISLLDPAVTRPGRLDVHVETGVLTESHRVRALQHFFARSPVEILGFPTSGGESASGSDWDKLLGWLASDAVSDGWSVAECEGFAHACAARVLRRAMKACAAEGLGGQELQGLSITADDILETVREL